MPTAPRWPQHTGMAACAIVQKIVELALKGNLQAIQEVTNRVEGTPRSHLEISGEVHRAYGPVATLASMRSWSDEELDAHLAECDILKRHSKPEVQ